MISFFKRLTWKKPPALNARERHLIFGDNAMESPVKTERKRTLVEILSEVACSIAGLYDRSKMQSRTLYEINDQLKHITQQLEDLKEANGRQRSKAKQTEYYLRRCRRKSAARRTYSQGA